MKVKTRNKVAKADMELRDQTETKNKIMDKEALRNPIS
jgi:hypothetical protein